VKRDSSEFFMKEATDGVLSLGIPAHSVTDDVTEVAPFAFSFTFALVIRAFPLSAPSMLR